MSAEKPRHVYEKAAIAQRGGGDAGRQRSRPQPGQASCGIGGLAAAISAAIASRFEVTIPTPSALPLPQRRGRADSTTWKHRQEMLTIEQPLGDGDGNRRVATGKRASAKLIRKIQHGQTNGHHVAQQTIDYRLH